MKIKNFIKENYKFIIVLILIVLFCTIKLPYYIMTTGGTINITDRVEMDGYQKEDKGSINMLYVSEYDATPFSYLLAKLRGEEINSNKERQISNESVEEINERNKIMRDNSLDIAVLVAYGEAGKDINIKSKKNIVMAKTTDNNFEVGDIILTVNDKVCDEVKDIKEIINNSEENDIIKFKVLRNEKELEIENKVVLEDNRKVVGVVIVTDYEYDLDPKIDIKFKNSESGSSGGLMLTLTIYNAVSNEDLIKGRNIAGTGTINADGTVGEIDGIKYKIMGAAKNNMDIVFVPSSNYEDAINTKNKYNYDLEIIKVDTFNEVLEYLRNN
ncbi:MAG: S16 family serine protease [Bacilli bacterium]